MLGRQANSDETLYTGHRFTSPENLFNVFLNDSNAILKGIIRNSDAMPVSTPLNNSHLLSPNLYLYNKALFLLFCLLLNCFHALIIYIHIDSGQDMWVDNNYAFHFLSCSL